MSKVMTARKVLNMLESKGDEAPLRVKLGEGRTRYISGPLATDSVHGIPYGDICFRTVSATGDAVVGSMWDELDDALNLLDKELRKTAQLWYYHGGLTYRVTGVYENRGTVMVKAAKE